MTARFMPRNVGRWTATLVGMIGIVLWATETVLINLTVGLPTFEVVGLAFAAASTLAPLAWWITGESPALALRLPPAAWLVTVPSLVGYHACIYFAVHRVPAAPAALLQGCTPLLIVLGAALLPGGRLRWWHVAGVLAGLEGLIGLAADGRGFVAFSDQATVLLVLIGIAAGLWGVYSLVSSRLGTVPTSAMGVFYGASAAVALLGHVMAEQWVPPTPTQWAAIAALGLLPMGLALFFWDYGLKKGNVQALGGAAYVEPLIGAALVVLFGQGRLDTGMLLSGFVILGGALLASADALEDAAAADAEHLQAEAASEAVARTADALSVLLPPALQAQLEWEAERLDCSPRLVLQAFVQRGLDQRHRLEPPPRRKVA